MFCHDQGRAFGQHPPPVVGPHSRDSSRPGVWLLGPAQAGSTVQVVPDAFGGFIAQPGRCWRMVLDPNHVEGLGEVRAMRSSLRRSSDDE